MAPGGRGGTKIFIARPDAGAVKGSRHQRHQRAMRVFHHGRQIPRRAGSVLKNREVGGLAVIVEGRGLAGDHFGHISVQHDLEIRGRLARDGEFFLVYDQQLGLAVADAQFQPVRPEQGEHRHADGARFQGAEQADIKRLRRLQHEGDAVAFFDPALDQPMRELAGLLCNLSEGDELRLADGADDAHGDAGRDRRSNGRYIHARC